MAGADEVRQDIACLLASNMSLALRSAIFLAVAALCLAAVQRVHATDVLSIPSKNQTSVLGQINFGDRQLHVETVRKSPKWLTVRKVDLVYPPAGQYNGATISCVQIVDLQQDGNNGKATIQKGGPGQKDVTVRFRSERGSGLYWNVYIWGK